MRRHLMRTVLSVVALSLLALALAGCGGAASTAARATPTGNGAANPSGSPEARVVTPACGPAVALAPTGSGYGGPIVPGNTGAVVGFQPLLPKWLTSDATWNYMALLTPQPKGAPPAAGPLPLFHASYRSRQQPKQATPSAQLAWRTTTSAYQVGIVALDESTATITPTSNIYAGSQPLHVSKQTGVTVAGQPGTLFALAPASGNTQVVGIIWRVGTLNLRLTAVAQGAYLEYLSTARPPSPGVTPNAADLLDHVVAWPGANGGVLQQMAASLAPFPACHS